MYRRFETRLNALSQAGIGVTLRSGRKGLEKESLRVTPDNRLSQRDHPRALGSPLTHPHITTDYSEAQLEFVTPPFTNIATVLAFQEEIHRFVYANLDDELLWATSMPCIVSGEASVPIARFGPSNSGRMKHIYRRGLELRYRRIMQIISGVHFNYSAPEALWTFLRESEAQMQSLPDVQSAGYFGLARNVLRYDWLITYLFGSSPGLCKSFMDGLPNDFQEFDKFTFYEPHATSLRMSSIGYKNQAPDLLRVSYDDLPTYLEGVWRATETLHPPYAALGVQVGGDYRQLNGNILQIENEFYGSIRPKRTPQNGERPLLALARRGVQYVELRSLDVQAFEAVGAGSSQLHFLEAFLLFCLLHESPPMDAQERDEAAANQTVAAHRGRAPGLTLQRNGAAVELRVWGLEVLHRVRDLATLMDADDSQQPYTAAVDEQIQAMEEPDRTASARLLAEMRRRRATFYEMAHLLSEKHRRHFLARPLPLERQRYFTELAARSWRQQADIEGQEQEPFERYLANYYAQTPLVDKAPC